MTLRISQLFLLILFALPSTYALDDIEIPKSTDNSGQNKYERINAIEKEFQSLAQSINEGRKEQRDFNTQLTTIKSDIKKMKDENLNLQKENENLRTSLAELKKSFIETQNALEQTRTSLYGDEGKREKDALLKKKF